MQLLLDTHSFLWFSNASPQLSAGALELIEEPANDIFLSIVSPWETGIKISTGKLTLNRSVDKFFEERMQASGIILLPIKLHHIAHISTLPFHHRDPFDRILVAQSLTENIPLVSADAALDAYGIVRLW